MTFDIMDSIINITNISNLFGTFKNSFGFKERNDIEYATTNTNIINKNKSGLLEVDRAKSPSGINKTNNLSDNTLYRIVAENVILRPTVALGGDLIRVRIPLKCVCIDEIISIADVNGKGYFSQKNSSIHMGDLILSVNGEEIFNVQRLADIVSNSNGEILKVKVIRDNKKITLKLRPIETIEEQKYMLGMNVIDCFDGVGTLTFYDLLTKKFGAAGHGIENQNLMKSFMSDKGKLYKSAVESVIKGKTYQTGEIISTVLDDNSIIGEINVENKYGIFGDITDNSVFNNHTSIPVASKNEVKIGPAVILASIDGSKVEEFAAVIENVSEKGNFQGCQNITIKITDPSLIKKTGGIVRGMSGSPIIQNDRLVGAVSHVTIRDSTIGYGVFAELMLENLYE